MYKYTIAERQETDGNRKVKVVETYNDGTKKTGSSPHEALPVFNLLSHHRLTRRGVICLY